MKTLTLLCAAIIGSVVLQGCSSLPQENKTAQNSTIKPATEIAARDFPAETLYALLVAEVAGSRNRLDITLGNYIQQAHKTRDPKVTARATHIAQYLKAHQATLDTAQLWLELEPNNNEARLIAATELAQSGRLLEAFEHSKILLEQGSTSIFQNIAAYSARATPADRETLLKGYNALLKDQPKHLQLLVGRGLILQQQKQPEQALKDAQKALKQDSDYIPAAILEAKLLNQLQRPEQALTRLNAMLERHPKNKRLRLQYARLLSSYDLEQAYVQFGTLVNDSPKDPDLRLSLALICLEQKHTQEAQQHLEVLLQQQQRTDTAHYYLGRLKEDAGKTDAALTHYLSVKAGNDFLQALLQASKIMVTREEFSRNHKHFEQARQNFPSESENLFILEAEVLRKNNHLGRSETLLNQGLKELPLNTKLLYSRAMLLESQQQLERAEQDLRTIIAYEPNNATALNALGYTLADNASSQDIELLNEALSLIEKALNITPDDPAVIDSIGWVHYRLGNYETAIIRLQQAMSALPDPEIAAHLGEVLWANGDASEANSVWAEGMKIDPSNTIIPETIQRITGNTAPE